MIKATVLSENSVYHKPGLMAEHGWSVFVETGRDKILFDTGQGQVLLHNARALGVELEAASAVVLSHRHWDHTGGLRAVVSLTKGIDVFAHSGLFKEAFRLDKGDAVPAGIPVGRAELESLGARFRFNRYFTEIARSVHLTGEVPRTTAFERGDRRLVARMGKGFCQDPILDDQALVVTRESGLFVLLGCCHAGLVNTVKHVIEKTGQSRIDTLIGGTHLGALPEKECAASIAALKEFDIGRIGVSHCTGAGPALRLKREFGDRFFFCSTGDVITL